ncbi:unnamed protein product [Allacma fusca]|uniref:Uncharacterized protein n=1 Tax=Allacma fusca TaxID=39272 RepID=A0A8J2KQD2_9HEXA|nr:unnamed protein product [Allacma fusca]
MIHTFFCNHWMQHFNHKNLMHATLCVHPQKLLNIFTSFKRLNNGFIHCTSSLLMPVYKIFFVFGHSLSLFVTIKCHNQIPLPQYLLFPVLSLTFTIVEGPIFTTMGQIRSNSKDSFKSWEYQTSKGWTKAFKSLQPLQLRVGSVYVIQKYTYLVVVLSVSNLTINALLIN